MKKLISLFLFSSLMACGGSSSDPATASRDDLNGPKNLRSIAVADGSEASVTLIWNTFNAEDELRGYDVFGVALGDLTLADLAGRVKYPTTFTESQIMSASFPRCGDNSSFFEAFGFKATDEDCEDAEEDELKKNTETSGYSLSAEEEDDDSPLKAKLACDGEDSTNVSLPTSGYQLGTVKCVIKNLKDPTNGEDVPIQAGTSYIFFVAAVAGDKYDELSWISNTVKDTPSTKIYSDSVTLSTDSTPATSKYVGLTFDFSNGATLTKGSETACTNAFCKLTGKTASSSAAGFYFGRDNTSNDNRERVFISVPATGNGLSLSSNGEMSIQFKRPAVSKEFANNDSLSSIGTDGMHPGDMAGSVYVYDGTHFPVYGDQIFDYQVQKDGATHYGKVIITDWRINDIADVTSESTIDIKSAVSFKVTVVLQMQAGSMDYWTF